jgi:DNA polymerase-1
MSTERLFLLDGMALAYRAYFTFISRPLINSKGENTSAIYGFVTALMKILGEERPDYIAVVFDTKEPTFRHQKFAEYKATRQKMPETMALQMDKLKDVVRAFNSPLLEVPGYEADDVIGTLARRAERERILTYMVTGDKDFMQLISPLIKMYKPGKSGGDPEIIGEPEVLEKFGVGPDKVIDVLGLTGDSSDNVPGVPGIGEKTAIPLIQQFGSIPALYDHIVEIPQKGVREKLQTNKEKAFLSRELVTIHTDVPVTADIHQLRAAAPNRQEILQLFRELEFRSLIERLGEVFKGKTGPEPAAVPAEPQPAPTIDIRTDEHSHHVVTTRQELADLIKRLKECPFFVIDTETTSRNPLQAGLVGISICMKPRTAFFVPVHPADGTTGIPADLFGNPRDTQAVPLESRPGLPAEDVITAFRAVFENPRIGKIGQNIKYDALVLKTHGVALEGIIFDTMVASYILRPDAPQSLEALAVEHLGYKTITYDELIGSGKDKREIQDISLNDLATYAAEDADITMRIFEAQQKRLKELELENLCATIEFPLISVLAEMECRGIRLDTEHLALMSKELERQIDSLVRNIHQLAGESFNINSTQQVADILFKKIKLRTVRKTKTGFSTDAGVLESLRGEHPIIENLLDYRLLTKLKSTYVDALPQLINGRTGRLHTTFNQTVAATGRLASSDPNLQNIPIRSEVGREIRRAFIPGSNGMLLMSADYSQIELRVMAHVCQDPGLSEAFRGGEDIHASTASKVFGVPPSQVTPDMRRKAKEVNFGIMYGLGPYGLATRLEISQTEAKEIISNYFLRFPKVREYIDATIASAKRNGYVTTLFGRRRYLPDINSRNKNVRSNAERQAINMPMQGTAADMIKKAMIAIHREIKSDGLRSRMLLQVHDELVFEVPEAEVNRLRELVISQMKNALPLSVPIEVEVGVGKNWLEAH